MKSITSYPSPSKTNPNKKSWSPLDRSSSEKYEGREDLYMNPPPPEALRRRLILVSYVEYEFQKMISWCSCVDSRQQSLQPSASYTNYRNNDKQFN